MSVVPLWLPAPSMTMPLPMSAWVQPSAAAVIVLLPAVVEMSVALANSPLATKSLIDTTWPMRSCTERSTAPAASGAWKAMRFKSALVLLRPTSVGPDAGRASSMSAWDSAVVMGSVLVAGTGKPSAPR